MKACDENGHLEGDPQVKKVRRSMRERRPNRKFVD